MREIKLRAWNKRLKKMLYLNLYGEKDNCARFEIYHNDWCLDFAEGNNEHLTDSSSGILMQFTGLFDKNGKEIYEGDVVKSPDFTGEIVYFEAHFQLKGKNSHTYLDTYLSQNLEVIGNIYSNPELLEKI